MRRGGSVYPQLARPLAAKLFDCPARDELPFLDDEELRGHGPRQLWVDAPSAPHDWFTSLSGVSVVRVEGSRFLLELDASADDQSILRAALATGPVREFRANVPSLLDVFREAMTERTARVAS